MKPMTFVVLLVFILSACGPAPTPTATLIPPMATFPPPTPTPTPKVAFPPHGYHSAAFDSKSDRIILYAGQLDSNHVLSDTWTYDIAQNRWAKMLPTLSPGDVEGPMVYDGAAGRTILFVGNLERDPHLYDLPGLPLGIDKASQTWAYDDNTSTWTDLKTAGGPSALLGARMVYDAQADRIILFGGLGVPLTQLGFVYSNETWVYDFHANTWTNMQPKTSPPGQNYSQMAYDAASDRVFAWITPDSGGSNTMWVYDYKANTWMAQPVKEPAWRAYGAMVYVPTVQRDFVFGGVTNDDNATPFNDMWTYDSVGQAWEQVSVSAGPSARGWHTLTYSSKLDRLVLIGGGKDRDHFTNEVWLFDPHGKTWTQVGPG